MAYQNNDWMTLSITFIRICTATSALRRSPRSHSLVPITSASYSNEVQVKPFTNMFWISVFVAPRHCFPHLILD
jgi:hypothetical protein